MLCWNSWHEVFLKSGTEFKDRISVLVEKWTRTFLHRCAGAWATQRGRSSPAGAATPSTTVLNRAGSSLQSTRQTPAMQKPLLQALAARSSRETSLRAPMPRFRAELWASLAEAAVLPCSCRCSVVWSCLLLFSPGAAVWDLSVRQGEEKGPIFQSLLCKTCGLSLTYRLSRAWTLGEHLE